MTNIPSSRVVNTFNQNSGDQAKMLSENSMQKNCAQTIQIARNGVRPCVSAEQLNELRRQFDRQHCILLPQLLDAQLLTLVLRQLEHANFAAFAHEGIGTEQRMEDNTLNGLLHFVINNPRLFDFVQEVTRCGRIGSFIGRVYRMIPGQGHYDSWHSDVGDDRMITLSLNLSTETYTGGVLRIREEDSRRIVHEVANTGLGDAILFRISGKLRHCVSSVEGTVTKTAFAGWFKIQPEYREILREMRGEISPAHNPSARKQDAHRS